MRLAPNHPHYNVWKQYVTALAQDEEVKVFCGPNETNSPAWHPDFTYTLKYPVKEWFIDSSFQVTENVGTWGPFKTEDEAVEHLLDKTSHLGRCPPQGPYDMWKSAMLRAMSGEDVYITYYGKRLDSPTWGGDATAYKVEKHAFYINEVDFIVQSHKCDALPRAYATTEEAQHVVSSAVSVLGRFPTGTQHVAIWREAMQRYINGEKIRLHTSMTWLSGPPDWTAEKYVICRYSPAKKYYFDNAFGIKLWDSLYLHPEAKFSTRQEAEAYKAEKAGHLGHDPHLGKTWLQAMQAAIHDGKDVMVQGHVNGVWKDCTIPTWNVLGSYRVVPARWSIDKTTFTPVRKSDGKFDAKKDAQAWLNEQTPRPNNRHTDLWKEYMTLLIDGKEPVLEYKSSAGLWVERLRKDVMLQGVDYRLKRSIDPEKLYWVVDIFDVHHMPGQYLMPKALELGIVFDTEEKAQKRLEQLQSWMRSTA